MFSPFKILEKSPKQLSRVTQWDGPSSPTQGLKGRQCWSSVPEVRSLVLSGWGTRVCVCGGVLLWVTLDVCVVHIITSLTEWICPLLFNFLFVNSMASTSNWQLKSLSLSLSSTRDAGRPEVVYFEKECNNGYLKKMTEVTEFLGRQAGRQAAPLDWGTI